MSPQSQTSQDKWSTILKRRLRKKQIEEEKSTKQTDKSTKRIKFKSARQTPSRQTPSRQTSSRAQSSRLDSSRAFSSRLGSSRVQSTSPYPQTNYLAALSTAKKLPAIVRNNKAKRNRGKIL